MADKIYCGSGKTRTGNFWEFYNISLKLSEIEMYTNEKGYINIVVNKRKQPDNYWNDLTVTINDYKPESKQPVETKLNEFWDKELSIEDIPF